MELGNFVHLHMHTEYSLLDGASRIDKLVERVKELGMNSVAITDHGNMFGAIDMYKKCQKEGIKLIFGFEAYVAPRSRLDKEGKVDTEPFHLILLAKNNVGYQNLIKLCSIGYVEGYYYKPRIDIDVIKKYSEGLICLSACLAGQLPRLIRDGKYEEAKNVALEYRDIFGEDSYYLEIQDNKLTEQREVNQRLIQMSSETGIKLVATNDCHYLMKEDSFFHEVLLCIQTGKRLSDPDRMRFTTEEYYVKTQEEMYNSFKNFEEAVLVTQTIADMCDVKIEFGNTILPHFDIPNNEISHLEYFTNLCNEGLYKKYSEDRLEEAKKRLEYEIGVIDKMGYIDYFLIVQDFINYAKNEGIPVGPGRGSGAGSIAAYLVGITDIDPLKFNLIFERFLNPERISMPDFDIDFCFERRQEVIDYVARRYGHDHVAQIITFGTMAARGAVRDVARVLDVPYAKADEIAKLIPTELKMTLGKALETSSEFRGMYENDEDAKKVIDLAILAEGMPRHASTHAAGVVITKDAVDSYVPLYRNNELISTQYTMTTLEELGLLKMDFLGLRTLTVINDAIYLVKKIHGIDVKFDEEMSDPAVYKLLSEGKTMGVFQFESGGITQMVKDLKPDRIEDIIVMVSLYRPGPMDQIPRYISNKNNKGHTIYTHKSLEPILNVTNGCMVYQEQVMQIFRDLAGYSLGRADLVRRAMGKKKLDVMAKEREIFINGLEEDDKIVIDGAVRRGIDKESANKIFDEMSEFAKYAFNKSHAAAYAVIAYQTAYLKVYYSKEFMAATMNSFLGNLDKIPMYINECKDMNIEVLKPDINESYARFSVINGKIRFSLESIKNVGENAIKQIIEERKANGRYLDFIDFCERVSGDQVNKKCIESLIKAGAFDELYNNRFDLLGNYEIILDSINQTRRNNYKEQVSMFELSSDSGEENGLKPTIRKIGTVPTKRELLDMEKEMTGLYISGHPLDDYTEKIKEITKMTIKDILPETISMDTEIPEEEAENINLINNRVKVFDGQEVTICVLIKELRTLQTKKGTTMAFGQVEDLYGIMEVVFFDRSYNLYRNAISKDNIVCISGKISLRETENPKILASVVKTIDDVSITKKIYIKLLEKQDDEKEEKIEKLKEIIKDSSGNCPIYIHYEKTKKTQMLTKNMWVKLDNQLINKLENVFGEKNIKLV